MPRNEDSCKRANEKAFKKRNGIAGIPEAPRRCWIIRLRLSPPESPQGVWQQSEEETSATIEMLLTVRARRSTGPKFAHVREPNENPLTFAEIV